MKSSSDLADIFDFAVKMSESSDVNDRIWGATAIKELRGIGEQLAQSKLIEPEMKKQLEEANDRLTQFIKDI